MLSLASVDAYIDVICSILDNFCVTYEREWSCPPPNGRIKFDIACFPENSSKPTLLIDFNGSVHEDEAFFQYRGSRPCRNRFHVLKALRREAKRARISVENGAYLLCLSIDDFKDSKHLREVLMVYVDAFVDMNHINSPEVGCAIMMSRHCPDYMYVCPNGRLSRDEKAYIEELSKNNCKYIVCETVPCFHGGVCPYGLIGKVRSDG